MNTRQFSEDDITQIFPLADGSVIVVGNPDLAEFADCFLNNFVDLGLGH